MIKKKNNNIYILFFQFCKQKNSARSPHYIRYDLNFVVSIHLVLYNCMTKMYLTFSFVKLNEHYYYIIAR